MREYNETGRLFERRVFGVCRWRREGYLSHRVALELVQKHQPEKETAFAHELRAKVAECLAAPVRPGQTDRRRHRGHPAAVH